jgi:hypothetical protein
MLPGRGGGLWLAQAVTSNKTIAKGIFLKEYMVYPFVSWIGFLAFFFFAFAGAFFSGLANAVLVAS